MQGKFLILGLLVLLTPTLDTSRFDVPIVSLPDDLTRAVPRIRSPVQGPTLSAARASLDLHADVDLQWRSLSLDLDDLPTSRWLTVEIPGHGLRRLRLVEHEQVHGSTHLQLDYDGLTSTFTRRGGLSFGVLAFPEGSYKVEQVGMHTRFVAQRQIALRTVDHEMDFRWIPDTHSGG